MKSWTGLSSLATVDLGGAVVRAGFLAMPLPQGFSSLDGDCRPAKR
jgi:hypothetical protein